MMSLCQSCSLPLDQTNNGTEIDGSKSQEYCELCYRNGNFIEPELTVNEMKEKVRIILKGRDWPRLFIFITLKQIPRLKRWRS